MIPFSRGQRFFILVSIKLRMQWDGGEQWMFPPGAERRDMTLTVELESIRAARKDLTRGGGLRYKASPSFRSQLPKPKPSVIQ